MKIMNLLSFGYWTDLRPRYFGAHAKTAVIAILIVFAALAAASFALKMAKGSYKKIFARLYSFFLTNFTVGAILFFFRFELVPFLSARFWAGLWIIASAIWAVSIAKDALRIPRSIKEAKIDKEKNKYIP